MALSHARQVLEVGGTGASTKSYRRRRDTGCNQQHYMETRKTRKHTVRQRDTVTFKQTVKKG